MCCLQYTAHIFCTTMFNTALYKHHYYILNSCIGAAPATIVIHILQAPFTHPLLIQSTRYALRFILLIHFKIQSTTLLSCIFPPLLRIPQVMLIISTPRNMKTSLSPLSIRFLTAPHTLLSIHCSTVPCSHPLCIVVSTILGSHFLHPLVPPVPTS